MPAKLLSTWAHDVKSLPSDYVMPPESRPGNVQICEELPVIDLSEKPGRDRPHIVREITQACEQYGLFQVINHGVSEKMMEEAMALYKEFFSMPEEDKLSLYSEDKNKPCILYTSGIQVTDTARYWKDTLKHYCHPLEEHMPTWPEKPTRFREEVRRYTTEVKKLAFRILDLISEGLGLKEGTLRGLLGNVHVLVCNNYPRCPDPSLALGVGSHIDPNVITVLQQDVYGLQYRMDGEWVGVEPIPNALVVNLGYLTEVLSNGKMKGADHRVVTNSVADRTSIAQFFGYDHESVVETPKELITPEHPQLYKSFVCNDFMKVYDDFSGRKCPGMVSPMDPFRL